MEQVDDEAHGEDAPSAIAGGTGTVYFRSPDFVTKRMDTRRQLSKILTETLCGYEIGLDSEYLVPAVKADADKNYVDLSMPRQGCDLVMLLNASEGAKLSSRVTWQVVENVCRGIAALQQMYGPLASHGDIKLDNVCASRSEKHPKRVLPSD